MGLKVFRSIPVNVIINPIALHTFVLKHQPPLIAATASRGIPMDIIRKSAQDKFTKMELNGVLNCKKVKEFHDEL